MVDVPKKIKIGPQVFTVKERTSADDGMLNDGSYGYTLDSGNLIVLDADVHISKKRAVLMHELLHAIRMVYDPTVKPNKDDDYDSWEHHFIAIWEFGVLAVLRDNPKLVEWLLDSNGS